MANEAPDQTPSADEGNLDLSGLSSMSLGPNWGSGNAPKARVPKESFNERPRGPRGPRMDRQGSPPRKRERFDKGPRRDGDRSEGHHRGQDRHQRTSRPVPFEPTVAVDFYPDEEPFKVLSQAIKTSSRTFELFEIARLILDKPERWVCVVRDPAQKEGDPARLHACVPDGLPFATEDEALSHTFRHYMGEFFTAETVEIDPPAGSFQMVHKCGMTGELLAPPNYHRYQAICREHHAAKLGHVSYSRFEERIVGSREEEDIQGWLTKMKTQTRCTSKENPELIFDNQEDARLHLVTEAKDKLVRPAYSARFSGKALALLNPDDPIRRSVEFLLEGQKRFPLDTANHLRGRLRRMHFAVYKRGSKGISFVCAVKRHFRKPNEVLADNLQNLIIFIEAHPNFPAKDLPKGYLGVDPVEKHEPVKEVEEPVSPAEPEAPVGAENPPESPAEEVIAAEPVVEVPQKKQPSKDELDALRQLKNDLHYLVSQGYIIEYSDGRLFVPPIREDEIRHLEKEKAAAEKAKAAAVVSKEESGKPEAATDSPKETVPSEVAQSTPVQAAPDPVEEAPTPEPTPEPVLEPEAVEVAVPVEESVTEAAVEEAGDVSPTEEEKGPAEGDPLDSQKSPEPETSVEPEVKVDPDVEAETAPEPEAMASDDAEDSTEAPEKTSEA